MCGVVRDIDVLVSEKPGGVVYASGDEVGHALEDAEGREFRVIGLSHGNVPEAAQDENMLLGVSVRHVLEEIGYSGASERWVLFFHDAEEAAGGWACWVRAHLSGGLLCGLHGRK